MSPSDRLRTHPVTVADLCRAIAERRVPASVRNGMYVVRSGDVRRLGDSQDDRSARSAPVSHRALW
jgi:hypothetical protein